MLVSAKAATLNLTGNLVKASLKEINLLLGRSHRIPLSWFLFVTMFILYIVYIYKRERVWMDDWND